MAQKTITKQFAIKAEEIGENAMQCAPSVMGVIDQGGDCIFPGFFKNALPEFSQNGFIPVGHTWDELPVAMPTLAEERGNILYSEVKFHSTQAGQDTRTVAMERLAAGLNMGLSVGFTCTDDGAMWFNNGKQLLDYAQKQNCDMSLFDVKGITAWKGICRGLLPEGCDTLYEFSIAPAPMNKLATALDVKSTGSEGDDLVRKALQRLVEMKGEYLGDVERGATCSAVSRVLSSLSSVIWRALYNVTAENAVGLAAQFAPAFDEARDFCVAIVEALLANADFAELAEDASYYYYYSTPPESRDVELKDVKPGGDKAHDLSLLSFSDNAEALGTAAEAFVKRASWVRELRVKAGRKLSRETLTQMQAIYDYLVEGCQMLQDMLGDAESGDAADTGDTSDDDTKSLIQKRLLAVRLELLREEL